MLYKYVGDRKLTYKGRQYNKGDLIELDGFDRMRPEWFEEVKEEKPVEEVPETTKRKKKEVE